MTDAQRLTWVRALHTAIYVVMAASSVFVLYAAIAGVHGPWLWTAAGLVLIESVVFLGNGLKCPLTAVAARYAGPAGGVSETFLPERLTRHTFKVFGPIIVVGFVLLAARLLGFGR